MKTTVEILKEMVAIPSVNPLLALEGEPDESHLANYIVSTLSAHGIKVWKQPVSEGRANVIAHVERAGNADDTLVLLSGHIDTYPAGSPHADFTPIVEGTTVYGRGSADAKGPLAAMVSALFTASQARSRREVYLAATIDEECLMSGVSELAALGIRPDIAITGEPTSLEPVGIQKGIVRGHMRLSHPSAHAAYPAQSSVFLSTAALIGAVAELNEHLASRTRHPLLGPATVSITTLSGNGGMNLVGDEVVVQFDARFLPGSTGEEFAAHIAQFVAERLNAATTFTMDTPSFISPANETDKANAAVHDFLATIGSVAGPRELGHFSYGSEAGILATFSKASLVFGPGDAKYSHGPTECIDTNELETAADILRAFVVRS
ncbi:M20 family metallopeptidase [Natronoglycomyces albus]|uniref:M20/M25/M40 family metallo-hydrolase n=1 Tax=Natronoglycomyces albus TaxID=2811108 RepID=A0A895XN40_9ACTN|nr:M20/M25/M40 family metallo-hydrolase [Natronoglycomyces albus]QSB05192.1 M20/M25/M40 family metallo-hydrolase [Natronoglycomyces albus]